VAGVTRALGLEAPSERKMRQILDDLIRQRQEMRRAVNDRDLLEANRLGIVYWQSRIARRRGSQGGC
jgi:hypothetical protein